MKTSKKYILYIAIPLLFVLAFILYNSIFGKPDMASDNPAGNPAQGRGAPGGGRALPVSVHVAGYMTADDGILVPGTLVANDRVELASELSGRVVEINFKEGQSVRKGDILVRLNDDELQAQLTRAEYQYKLLGQKLERQEILLKKEAVSREDYDQVSTEYNVLRQDIEQLKIKIEKMKIRAPFNGIIGFRYISNGAMLMPNSNVATIVDASNLIAEFSVPEKYVFNNLIGRDANFTVEGNSRKYSATVYAVDPEIDVKTRTILIRARFNNSRGELRPGMSARVSLSSQAEKKNIYIPNQAIVSGVKGHSVWLLKEGKARSQEVQSGTRSVDMMEILSGVEEGDTVIITGLMQLREGIAVKASKN
ncbi:MAG: efflux RND transporter periplasmic adaptor subunit [Bacteroidales bacterium]|nr:efflux RND transporter periplasmic adaptor subunit [Bacteroidales bacterium]MDD2425269.1 efflux RND transporter periplasmic adaptor subunit [Bacteroidales bacterium]MDD3989256.1 efflux RND transporter periplasmic adaptor subunit [Bacteroidales bacterium]